MKNSTPGQRTRKRPLFRHTVLLAVTGAIALAATGFTGLSAQTENDNPSDQAAVSGLVGVVVSQALVVVGGSLGGATVAPVFTNDEGTAFSVGAQVHTGERFTISLALGNKGQAAISSQLTISGPEGISLKVVGQDGARDLTALESGTWAFRLEPGESDLDPDLVVTAAVSPIAQAGKYDLLFSIEPLALPMPDSTGDAGSK